MSSFELPHGPGLYLIDKPAGLSSAKVVSHIKRHTGIPRTGHGGTLDPFATGLLPVLVGREFTKQADSLLMGNKTYVLKVRFGSETDSGDLTGVVVSRGAQLPSKTAIETGLTWFQGEILQEPPAYSALKHQGRPLYWYARRGKTVVKEPRLIQILSIRLLEWLAPDAVIEVECSKGAYMRSLATDLGRALGCGAHLTELRRTRVANLSVEDAIPLWRFTSVANQTPKSPSNG
ncbi:MAG TPA: tRNA pseudouridine(55) synthase TruB [Myxococcota bacterium]|nr:MAG: tRNA pseudouridine synthase B [Deltaproteobacteria bacterium ADurb.Bin058]HQC44784.1 tRNA pseudouridine(55) synthase TruB [Myxococcota bacterium]